MVEVGRCAHTYPRVSWWLGKEREGRSEVRAGTKIESTDPKHHGVSQMIVRLLHGYYKTVEET